jgi:predicted DNA-binding transcriptional regulator AlpA
VSERLAEGRSSSKLLTPGELAERLGMTKDWVYARSREWVKSNGRRGIPTVRLGRFYRYRSDAIALWEGQLEQGEADA